MMQAARKKRTAAEMAIALRIVLERAGEEGAVALSLLVGLNYILRSSSLSI